MVLGFTGTSKGMTQRQHAAVRYLFEELQLTTLHHGDCVEADAAVHRDAVAMGVKVVVHPPTDAKLRAFCVSGGVNTVILPGRPYLKRNRDIVAAGVDGLVAAPNRDFEVLRSGTWSTVRVARKMKRRIWIVFPDGTFKEEHDS